MRSAPEQGAIGNVLVTGGAGFIGCALAQLLARRRRALGRRRQPAPAGAPDAPSDRPRCTRPPSWSSPTSSSADTWDRVLADFRPGRRRPPGRRDRHGAVAEREHPPRLGQRRRHHPAARRADPGRPGARPPGPDQSAAPCTARAPGAVRDGTLFQPGAAHPRPARRRPVGLPGRDPRAQLRAEHARPAPVERVRRHQARPGARARRVGRLARRAAVGAAPPERLRPRPVAHQPLHRASCRCSPSSPGDGRVHPALRGRRDHPRLRLHRRRGVGPGRGRRRTADGSAARTLDVGAGVRTTIRDLATTVAALPRCARAARDRSVPRRRRPSRRLRRDAARWPSWPGHPRWSLADGVGALQDWIEERLG